MIEKSLAWVRDLVADANQRMRPKHKICPISE
jgi:hypothetical protein